VIDWPLAFSTASQAIKLTNDLRSIDKEIGQAELKLKVADLSNALADLKMLLTEAKSEAAEKDEEIARLQKLQRRQADDTVELYGYRYRKRTDVPRNIATDKHA
jgi:predicted  nucleic acid-binding Zn-ribbon protein